MKAFDLNDNIIKWGSEEIVIPYFWENDGKHHRYFTDFIIVFKSKTGIKKALIEVKPYAQTIEPVMKKGKKRITILREAETYSKNMAKWSAAKEFCRINGYEFLIMTEHDIFPGGKVW